MKEVQDYLSFRLLIAPTVVKLVYTAAAILFTIGGVWYVFHIITTPTEPMSHAVRGVAVLVVGNLLWRLICEVWILFFNMHNTLTSIADSQQAFGDYIQAAQRRQIKREQQQRGPAPA